MESEQELIDVVYEFEFTQVIFNIFFILLIGLIFLIGYCGVRHMRYLIEEV